jgi:multiple sugar transport system permease protein
MTTITTARPPVSSAAVRARPRRRRRIRRSIGNALAVVVALVFSAPIIYLVIGSLKPPGQVLDGLGALTPRDLTFQNYSGVLHYFNNGATGYFADFYRTSLIVSSVVVIGGLVVNSLAGYALARLRWRGRKIVLIAVIALVILPFQSIAVPLYYMLDSQRDTLQVQFLPFIASAISIFLFYTFFAGMPREFEEAAAIDGAGPWRTLFTVILPNAKPVFASVAILSFLTSWSMYLWPVMVIDQPGYMPLPLEIGVFQSQPPYNWGQIFAFGVLLVVPVVVAFLIFQRWFVQSLASSAVKG